MRSTAALALIAAAPVVLAAVLGSVATLPNIPGWYEDLIKPPLNPPNSVFGPVWTALYTMMALAFYRVLRLHLAPDRTHAIVAFIVQLALNMSWSFAFFALHSPPLGMLVVTAMEVAVIITVIRFARVDRVAAWLMAPTIVWVAFAAYLNAGVWWLNRG